MSHEAVISDVKDELARICLELNLISVEIYEQLKKHAQNTNDSIYDLIKKDGHVSDVGLIAKLEAKYGVLADANAYSITPKSKNFPINYCHKNALIPIYEDDSMLVVGVVAPSTLNYLKNLNLLIGKKVSAKFISLELLSDELLGAKAISSEVVLTESDMKEVNTHQDITPQQMDEILSNNATQNIPESVLVPPKSQHANIAPKISKKNFDSNNVVPAVDDILSQAVDTGVSDIHFEIFKDYSNIRFRKNGTLIPVAEFRKFVTDNYVAVVARIKILANLDIAERRLPQDGKISFKSKAGTQVDFRVSVLPTNLGERIVIRVLNSSSLAVSVDGLGFSDQQKADFIEAIEAPQGMVLVTGPTGSGKSTTLYGAINYLNKPDVNIMTAEDPVEYTLSGISQVQIREDIGLTFSNALRSFLRQDPEIILVGEIRDTDTADIATKASLTGHLVLSTLHTNSAVGAITRLVNMGLPSYLVSSALTLVVAQRLIRVNCKQCLVSDDASMPQIKKIAEGTSSVISHLKKGKGCPACLNTGYSGRKAIHEVLRITPAIQDAINTGANENEIELIAQSEGYKTMVASAMRYLASGDLSVEEFFRVVPNDLEKS